MKVIWYCKLSRVYKFSTKYEFERIKCQRGETVLVKIENLDMPDDVARSIVEKLNEIHAANILNNFHGLN
ncbi:hypothetical protein SAMN05421640_3482 [Ekhidna lutea]|uniref:Uncharacterized protein n=1 Tax=Ekhidna lutea TaxID=447679 RepID=A0A239LZM2_EKHLU|nr:hypothetical protein SAMN05421640_3482 [Ekhidna lutea]